MVDVHRVSSMELWSDVGSSSRISIGFWQGCTPGCDGNMMGRGGRVWSVDGAAERVALAPCQCDSLGGTARLMHFDGVSASNVNGFLACDCPHKDLILT